MFQRRSPYEKERMALDHAENAWIAARKKQKEPALNRLLDGKVPAGLQNTLHAAFRKAFERLFSNGGDIIDKTYSIQKSKDTYEINRCAVRIRPDRKNLRAFSKEAKRTARGNTALSGAAGIGMGLLGIGLPDIPLLVSMLIKSIRQIAGSYGYTADTAVERYYILLILACAVSVGDSAVSQNDAVNTFGRILAKQEPMTVSEQVLSAQIRRTADALSRSLLYLKFVQTLPIVGVVGGISDIGITHMVTEYAERKYRYRFYTEKENDLK